MRELTNPPGVAPPADFQGALPLVYATGPGPAVVSIDVNNDIRPGLIHNIFATIPGRDYGSPTDRAVLLGNHRDAWVFGACDPNSGTAALLEVARGLGKLLRTGWRPRRTLILCSWDGEEYGLLGSTAWAEQRGPALQQTALAYLNVDVGVAGRDLSVHASPLLAPAIRGAVARLTDPATRQPLAQVWDGVVGDLGSGSDYTVFLDRLGISSVDLSFRRKEAQASAYGVYHSVYDSFSYVEQQVDPDFQYHVLQSQLWGLLALRLASEHVVPLAPAALAQALQARYIPYVKALLQGDSCSGQCSKIQRAAAHRRRSRVADKDALDLSPLEVAAAKFEAAAADPLLAREVARCSGATSEPRLRGRAGSMCGRKRLARLNEALRGVESALLSQDGLPGRQWFRHVLQAPGLYLGYGADLFPGVCQAIRDGDLALAQRQVGVCAARVLAAAAALESWKAPASDSVVVVD